MNQSNGPDITAVLKRFGDQDAQAQSELIHAVYGELHVMAGRYMAREKPGHTLQPTALVNEAWLRLVRIKSIDWNSRTQFFAVAARIMRHILVDNARRYLAGDLGGKGNLLPLDDLVPQGGPQECSQVIEVDLALERLASVDERAAKVVELRFFGGLTVGETAEALEIAPRAVERDWTFGRAWLRDQLKGRQLGLEGAGLGVDGRAS